MFQEMGDARFAQGFVGGTHLVPEHMRHYGRAPVGNDHDLKAVVEPEFSGVAERDGVPVGFSVFIRDLNQLLRGGRGRLTPSCR